MHLATLIATASALALGARAGTINARVPLLGSFGVSEQLGCPLGPQLVFPVGYGDGCGVCKSFYGNTSYASIHSYGFSQYCVLTVFTTPDCSDGGIQSGPGCWSPPGGVAGYKVSCPWWPEDTYMPACNQP